MTCRYIQAGYANPLSHAAGANLERLDMVLRGIKREQGTPSRRKLPITQDILLKICQVLRAGIFGVYMDKLMLACCTMAFAGF